MKQQQPKLLIPCLVLVILFQTGVLVMVYLSAQYPLWTGQTILLKTTPRDPRSLFRGNYAFLTYEIANIPAEDINKIRSPRRNEIVYIRLTPLPDKSGIYQYNGVDFNKPKTGLFIRGRLQNTDPVTSGFYLVSYGIEAYFAPKAKALALEKQLAQSALARIRVAPSGKAALEGVIHDK